MTKVRIHEGDQNVFAELRLPDAEGQYLKAQLVAELYRLSGEMKLTQAATGALLGISQPEVSRLFHGNFREYSVERLLGFLTAFNRDVEIVVRARETQAPGEITFTRAA